MFEIPAGMIIPQTIQSLPRDKRGYPIPWFVPDDAAKESDLRFACPRKRSFAYTKRLCWVCGQKLDRLSVFIGGPFSAWNRRFSDWCMHPQCAEFSLACCPFLNGDMVKRAQKIDRPSFVGAGHIDDRPPLAGFYATSLPVTMYPDKLFHPGGPRYVWWYRDGVKISNQEARPILRDYFERSTAKNPHLRKTQYVVSI